MTVRAQEVGASKGRPRAARGLLRLAATIPLAFALLALLAPAAWAHQGTATISCKKVTYSFSLFPAKPGNTVHENIFEDGFRIDSQNYTFDGSTGGNTISITILGDHTVAAQARWNTNGVQGSFEVSRALVKCGGIG
jgi:hypothetical protein